MIANIRVMFVAIGFIFWLGSSSDIKAEVLCAQAKLVKTKVKIYYQLLSEASCPKGFTKVIDTAALVEALSSKILGQPGPQGPQGLQGPQGIQGQQGPQGSPDTSLQILTKLLQVDGQGSGLDADTLQGFSASDLSGNVLYTRWGRSDCPSGTSLVYDGIVGGSHHAHSGSGTNLLCLSKQPTSAGFNDGNQNGALIYGAEYETAGSGLSALQALQDLNVPCVVCLREGAKVMLMQPGRDVCPVGFTREYAGYLMATNYAQTKSEFVCVDQQPVGVPGTAGNSDGALLYPAEAECGSLPCLPYTQDREITCSVCSK